MPVTNKQVAERLGVSPATVSFVLNNKPGISESTRRRVFEAFEQLGDSGRRTRAAAASISFIVYKKHGKVVSDTPFFSQLIEGLQERCLSRGYHLGILYTNGNTESLLAGSLPPDCSGVIVLATEMAAGDLAPIKALGVPFLILDSHFSAESFDAVTIDNVQGACLAASHLIGMGHERLGHIRSSFPINNFTERREGFLAAAKAAGLPEAALTEFFVEPTVDGAYRDMCGVLDGGVVLPTAFFADNDIIAAGCIRALREYGVRIPEDISVVGFDDMPLGEAIDPPLTTVRVPKQRMGMLAVDRLVARISHETEEDVHIAVKTTLVPRGSAAARSK